MTTLIGFWLEVARTDMVDAMIGVKLSIVNVITCVSMMIFSIFVARFLIGLGGGFPYLPPPITVLVDAKLGFILNHSLVDSCL